MPSNPIDVFRPPNKRKGFCSWSGKKTQMTPEDEILCKSKGAANCPACGKLTPVRWNSQTKMMILSPHKSD